MIPKTRDIVRPGDRVRTADWCMFDGVQVPPGEVGTVTGTLGRRITVAFDRDAQGPGRPVKERVAWGKWLTLHERAVDRLDAERSRIARDLGTDR